MICSRREHTTLLRRSRFREREWRSKNVKIHRLRTGAAFAAVLIIGLGSGFMIARAGQAHPYEVTANRGLVNALSNVGANLLGTAVFSATLEEEMGFSPCIKIDISAQSQI